MTLIGRSLLSCPPAWDHRWRANLWPLLPAHRPGASSASALSCSVQAAASGLPCHLGSSRHPESMPIWQPGKDTAGGAVTVTCLLSAVSFCADKHAEKAYTWTQRHTAACAHVSENTSWFFSSPLGGLLAWKWIKDFDFYTWNPPDFSVCVPWCAEPRLAFFWSPSLIFLDVRMGSTQGQITWLLWLQTLAFTKKLAEACVTPYGRPIDETVFILVWKMWLQEIGLHWKFSECLFCNKSNYLTVKTWIC